MKNPPTLRHPHERSDAIDFLHQVMLDENQPFDARIRAAINLLQQTTAGERIARGIGGNAERFQARVRAQAR